MGEIPNVCRWGIPLFDDWITQGISMVTQSSWTNLILMISKLLVFIQTDTGSGNTLSAMSIAFGSLMDCISCSVV
jgi:hypothetical protein